MNISYKYKNKIFNNIRDIIENNRLYPDFHFFQEEFIPFQGFMSGRTFFEGVSIHSDIKFDVLDQRQEEFNFDFFVTCINKYLRNHDYKSLKNPISAVSGGVDSSTIALTLKPSTIYSGYYEGDDFFSELPYSSLVASAIDAKHYKFKLDEDDFINNLSDYFEVIGNPIAGMGGVMEFTLIKKILKEVDTDVILFGNGGDEIFLGYYFNYFVKEFYEYGQQKPLYMPNFYPQKKSITNNVIDFMILSSLNRGSVDFMYTDFVYSKLLPQLEKMNSILEKILYVNINYTLPSLLHPYNQYSHEFGIKCLNPLSNEDFIKNSLYLNTPISEVPKKRLRDINPILPDEIKYNFVKRGFPMPIKNWTKLSKLIEKYYHRFFDRKEVKIIKLPYNGIDRFAWGVFQVEWFLEHYFDNNFKG